MATSYSPKIVTDGLILVLDVFNPKSYQSPNTFITNMIQGVNNVNYNFVGNVSLDPNELALVHDAPVLTTSARFTISPSISFIDQSERTFEYFINYNDSGSSVNSLFGANSTSPWAMIQRSGSSWRFRYRQQGGTYIEGSYVTFNTIEIRKWTHFIFRFDSSKNIDVFVNGNYHQTLVTTTTQLNITRIFGGYSSGGNVYDWNGKSSLVRLYNRALSNDEILQNYNATKSRYGL
jgi:hypothetical protein